METITNHNINNNKRKTTCSEQVSNNSNKLPPISQLVNTNNINLPPITVNSNNNNIISNNNSNNNKNLKKKKNSNFIFNNNKNNNTFSITPICNSEITMGWLLERNPNFAISTNQYYPIINNCQPIDYSGYTFNEKEISIENNKKWIIVKNNNKKQQQQNNEEESINYKKRKIEEISNNLNNNNNNNCKEIEPIYMFSNNSKKSLLNLNYNFEIKSIPDHLIDYYQNLRIKEIKYQTRRTFQSNENSLLIECRGFIISFLEELTTTIRMTKNTLEMTLSIYDDYMETQVQYIETKQFKLESLQLVAICSLNLAAKLEESEEFQPSIEELNYSTSNSYKIEEIIRMEMNMLNTLKFEINYPTPSHFLDYLLLISVQPYDCLNIEDYSTIANKFKTVNNHLYKMIYRDINIIRKELPSIIACASIAATRTILGIEPAWKESLFQISTISMKDIYHLYSKLIIEFNTDEGFTFIPEDFFQTTTNKIENYKLLNILS